MNWFKSFRKAQPVSSASGSQGPDEPLSNFTPRATQVLALAREEAARFRHNFVGTEHLLLGLVRLGQGVAVNVLTKLGLDLETLRQEVERLVGRGPDEQACWPIPYTPRVKKVLALAAKEARALNHTYVGTEHILLGLLREGDGVAAHVLKHFEVDIEKTRQEILKELDPNYLSVDHMSEPSAPPADATPASPRGDVVDTSKRYDVYCSEQKGPVVVYRNTLFKGLKSLFRKDRDDSLSEFLELEQADGQRIFVVRASVIKFCKPGVTPQAESASDSQG